MGDEGVRELEITRGIRTREETISPAQIELQPKYCPICREANKHNAKFCFKCNFTISTEGALENREKEAEALKEAENTKKTLAEIQTRQSAFESVLKKMVASDLDVDINDPEEQERIAQVLKKVLTSKWQLFPPTE